MNVEIVLLVILLLNLVHKHVQCAHRANIQRILVLLNVIHVLPAQDQLYQEPPVFLQAHHAVQETIELVLTVRNVKEDVSVVEMMQCPVLFVNLAILALLLVVLHAYYVVDQLILSLVLQVANHVHPIKFLIPTDQDV